MPKPILALAFLCLAAAQSRAQSPRKDPILRAMKSEIERSERALRDAGPAPMYHIGYQVRDARTYDLTAVLGAIHGDSLNRHRTLDVDLRVGSPQVDNTHQMKGLAWNPEDYGGAMTNFTISDDPDALRADLWAQTDRAFRAAQQRFTKVKTNIAVTTPDEDPSDDFSQEDSGSDYRTVDWPDIDRELWRARLKRLSSAAKKYPFLLDSDVSLSARCENRYIVTSDGKEIVTGDRFVRLTYTLRARAEDGMMLERFRSYDGFQMEDLKDQAGILEDFEKSAEELRSLLAAPVVEPYSGPAIFKNVATAVFFHEILGHRLEGHRQKLDEEGQTFTKMLGKPITADFIDVDDDATLDRFNGLALRGFYRYDDEGVKARKVRLVKNGVLSGFLLSRSPIRGFPRSNGHGRRSAGNPIVARMGNIVVRASKSTTYEHLREKLLEEVRRQEKPYGLVFEDIGGGFTNTSRSGAQSFKVLPKLVYRVYPDGRPDEIVRGVDIVGTPLSSFTNILAAADDDAVFNGTCGAESGWVPVSAIAPSLLVSEVEVEKNEKASEKPPILPAPLHDPGTAEAP
jgi:predicted Zn-dependent protease